MAGSASQLANQIRDGDLSAFQTLDADAWQRLASLKDEDDRSLFHTAAANGHLGVVEGFLTNGGQKLVNQPDEDGWTPLMSASSSGRDAVVQRLLAAEADVNAGNASKRTALHYAASKGHVDILSSLLAAGADALQKDSAGATALHRACSAFQLPAVRALLTAAPSLVNMTDGQGDTPLHVTVSVGQEPRSVEIAQELVRHGADLEKKNKAGEGPLALFGGELPGSIVRALAGGDVSMQED